MKRKVLSMMMVLSLTAACLSGCGGKKAETEAPTEAKTEAVTEKVTEAAEEETEAATEAAAEEETEAATEAAAEEETEAATEEVTEAATEAVTEAATEEVTEAATEAAAEEETEAATEAATEEETEAATEEETEAATEAVTEAATEEVTEAATEAAAEEETEAATEAVTEAATEEETEAATEAVTEAATEEETEAATEAVTEAATEEETEAVTEAAEEETEAATEAAETEAAVPVEISDEVIKIGVFEPLTGENGGGGIQEAQGAEYANEQRPAVIIDGVQYTVELDVVDNKSDKTEAVTAAQKLVSDGVVGVIGTYGSGCAIAAGPTFAEAKIPAIGASCTNPQVTAGCEYYFRVCFLDPFQGSVMAQYAFDEGYKKVAVIDQLGDDYSTGLANFFVKKFEELGGEISTNQQFQTNQSDFKAILTEVKASGAEAIFAPSSITTAPLLIKQARELGIDVPMMAGDTWYNTTIIDNAGVEYTEGMVCSTFFDEADTSSEVTVDFVTGYKEWLNADEKRIEKNGGNDDIVGNTALCYDAYNVMCDAIEAAGSTDGEAVKAALEGLEMEGVTGKITFDANGDAEKDTAYISVVKDGKFEFLKTVTVQ